MPSLGADMEHGTLVEWLVKPGDYVHRGDLVAVVDTDKADIDVETFEEGVIAELLVEVGASVPVGTALARIVQTPAAGAAPAPASAPAKQSSRASTQPVVSPPVRHLAHQLGVDTARVQGTGTHGALTRLDVERAAAAAPQSGSAPVPASPVSESAAVPASERVRSSPRARRLAGELGIDLLTVAGTGPEGAVTEADIRAAPTTASRPTSGPRVPRPTTPSAPTAPAAPIAPPARTPPSSAPGSPRAESLRRATGVLMARSKTTIPHYYLSATIDMGAALEWLHAANEQRPVSARLVPSVLLLKAVARAAAAMPDMNGFFTDDRFTPSSAVHLGVAVALRHGGLVAPAIHDADTCGVTELMERLKDLVSRARNGHLQRAEMADPTITVTSLGDLGVEAVFGVIYPPQVALVGFGVVSERPVARGGLLGVRPVVTATLSADHRVSDGLRGARFLAMIDDVMQKPEEL
ncbi:MAG: dihydrolipoamide acetyltransferase family protein [Cryobacterium sp.]